MDNSKNSFYYRMFLKSLFFPKTTVQKKNRDHTFNKYCDDVPASSTVTIVMAVIIGVEVVVVVKAAGAAAVPAVRRAVCSIVQSPSSVYC